jgi:hypothetical protein
MAKKTKPTEAGQPLLIDGKLIPQDPGNHDFLTLCEKVRSKEIAAPEGLILPEDADEA